MLESILIHLGLFKQFIPYLIILATLWLTYSYVILKAGFVSDDLAGIESFDGTLIYPRDDGKLDAKGQIIKERKICYGTLSKWVRNKLCGGNFPSRHKYKKPDGTDGDPIPSGKIPSHHHALSVVAQSIACLLLYQFLLTITTPKIALLTVCLFIVHPTCLQAVAWPSAIGYILSLICICASLLISRWTIAQTVPWAFVLGLSGLAFFQVWGVYAQGIPLATCAIMLLLGQWQLAIFSGVIAGIAAFINLGGYVKYRKDEFKKQAMEQSTFLSWRKPIVVLKTIAYYFYLAVWPACLGLYHTWGFHYDKEIERWDWRAYCGLLLFLLSVYLFLTTGSQEVRLGILWFYAFIFLFLNWITAQQWVTERYLYIPVIGFCLVASLYLPLVVYFLIFGMLLSRTLCHVATYDNELRFYQSNTWNFPKSEVAYGNLGVAYASVGLGGSANDCWIVASSLNKEYDVPFYNMYSATKTRGFSMIQQGAYEQGLNTLVSVLPLTEKVLSSKILHFKDAWTKEFQEFKSILSNPIGLLMSEMNRLHILKFILANELVIAKDDKRRNEVLPSISDNDKQIDNLKSYLLSKGIVFEFNPEKAFLQKLIQPKGVL